MNRKQPAKRGRKPAPPGAKLQQLTVRLPPSQRLALELLARELGLSISQVVERALASAVAQWPVAGLPAADQVMRFNGATGNRWKKADPKEVEALAEEILDSEPLFILHLPQELRREDEALFHDALHQLTEANGGQMPFPANSPEAEELLAACRHAYRRGQDRSLGELYPDLLSPEAGPDGVIDHLSPDGQSHEEPGEQ